MYAASAWVPINKNSEIPLWITKPWNIIQKTAAKIITGCFKTVSNSIAEAEAGIEPLDIQLRKRITRHWINCHTLPHDHPFWQCRSVITGERDTYQSPFARLARLYPIQLEQFETITPFPVKPHQQEWGSRINLTEDGPEETANLLKHRPRVKIYTHASGRHGLIGIGVVMMIGNKTRKSVSRTIGKHEEINVYFAQIGAILEALSLAEEIFKTTPALKNVMEVVIYSSGQTALRSILKPYLQSGQAAIQEVISRLTTLRQEDIKITIQWLPASNEEEGAQLAKAAASYATREGWTINPPRWAKTQLKSTTWRLARESLQQARIKQFNQSTGGKYTKALDSALPGKHTRMLYDQLTRIQAATLVQLRTGHNRLNTFLHRIGSTDSNLCNCTDGPETVEHFLFYCARWDHLRDEMRTAMGERFGELSHALGGKTPQPSTEDRPTDSKIHWKPDMEVVKAVLRFTARSKRLDQESENS
jgi:ribonuclease HI